ARAKLARIAVELAELKGDQAATRRLGKGDRAKLLRLAEDFPARLRAAAPQLARKLLAEWLDGGTLDPTTGRLTLRVGQVPAELKARAVTRGRCSGRRSPRRPRE